MANLAGVRPRIDISHPRYPEPSAASLRVEVEGKQAIVPRFLIVPMSEADLYELAEEALKVAGVLRKGTRRA